MKFFDKDRKFELIRIIVIGLIIIIAATAAADYLGFLIKTPPRFALPLISYENGSVDYYGLGYKIFSDVNNLSGEVHYYYNAWFVPKFFYVK
ncbi:MAG: hypothetical protein LBL87_04240 [Ruminococcus sp.]|nr:hypothetical protein [Ruminococcus sp.]